MSAHTTTIVSSKGSTKATFAAAYIAVTLAQITNALPGALNGAFQVEFQTTGSELTWIAAAFMIGIVVFELTFGVLGDLYGRKRLLFAGFATVTLGSLIAALAPTAQVMILAQAVGGIGAGILFPISLSMIVALVPDVRARAKTIATWAGFLSLGAVISPVLAGFTSQVFTTETFDGWRLSYYAAAVIAILAVVIALRSVDSSAPEGRKPDVPGQVTLALGLIGILYATVQGSEGNWGRPDVIGGYILGGLLLVAFVIIEARTKSPLVHLVLFKNASYSIVGIVAVIGMFAFLATCFSTSISVGALAQQETWKVGVLFVFIQGPAFVLIPVVGWLIHRVSPRWVLTVGFALTAVAGYILSGYSLGVPEEFGGTPWTSFIPPLLVLGVGFALTVGSITAVAQHRAAALHRHGVGDDQSPARPGLRPGSSARRCDRLQRRRRRIRGGVPRARIVAGAAGAHGGRTVARAAHRIPVLAGAAGGGRRRRRPRGRRSGDGARGRLARVGLLDRVPRRGHRGNRVCRAHSLRQRKARRHAAHRRGAR